MKQYTASYNSIDIQHKHISIYLQCIFESEHFLYIDVRHYSRLLTIHTRDFK